MAHTWNAVTSPVASVVRQSVEDRHATLVSLWVSDCCFVQVSPALVNRKTLPTASTARKLIGCMYQRFNLLVPSILCLVGHGLKVVTLPVVSAATHSDEEAQWTLVRSSPSAYSLVQLVPLLVEMKMLPMLSTATQVGAGAGDGGETVGAVDAGLGRGGGAF